MKTYKAKLEVNGKIVTVYEGAKTKAIALRNLKKLGKVLDLQTL